VDTSQKRRKTRNDGAGLNKDKSLFNFAGLDFWKRQLPRNLLGSPHRMETSRKAAKANREAEHERKKLSKLNAKLGENVEQVQGDFSLMDIADNSYFLVFFVVAGTSLSPYLY